MAQPTSLTAPERETVIIMDDATGVATICTHQRRVVTKLRNNPAARELEDLTFGATVGARFEIDASLISFRTKRVKGRPGNPNAFTRRIGRVSDAA